MRGLFVQVLKGLFSIYNLQVQLLVIVQVLILYGLCIIYHISNVIGLWISDPYLLNRDWLDWWLKRSQVLIIFGYYLLLKF